MKIFKPLHWDINNLFFFFSNFLLDTCPFLGPLIPLFRTSGDVSSGFQSQSGFCLIRTSRMCTWYTFPEIHLWCNTSAGVYSQHSSQLLSPHACFSRGKMPDLNHRPPAWQADALTTRPQRPDLIIYSYKVEKELYCYKILFFYYVQERGSE